MQENFSPLKKIYLIIYLYSIKEEEDKKKEKRLPEIEDIVDDFLKHKIDFEKKNNEDMDSYYKGNE
jgi:hypothetical protein